MIKPFEKLQFSQQDTISRRADLLNKLTGGLSSIFARILSYVGEATVAPIAGTATLDFGATPAETASVVVTGQTWVKPTTRLTASFMRESTADNGLDEHEEGAAMCPLSCGAIVPGVGFTIYANPLSALGSGKFTVGWEGYP